MKQQRLNIKEFRNKHALPAGRKDVIMDQAVVEAGPVQNICGQSGESKSMITKQKEDIGKPKPLTGELKAWLKGRKEWNHDEWLALLADLRSKGFIALTESPEGRASIGKFLEANKSR